MWFVVVRKRPPTPFALRTTKPNPTVVVLPVLTPAAEHYLCGKKQSDAIGVAEEQSNGGRHDCHNAKQRPQSEAEVCRGISGGGFVHESRIDP
jgi:hypothetical protein